MRDTFVNTLVMLARKDRNIELLTGDLGFGVLKPFWEQCPNQFTNAGIAEQNMASLAAGMAMEGKTVFIYSIGNFPTLRCLEQIRNDCAYHNVNVKIVCVGGGFAYGSLGMSHQATEDLAILRSLPNVAVFAPGDLLEAEAVTKAIAEYTGTCYLRLGRGGEKQIHEKTIDYQIGEAIQIRDGEDIALFSTGAILDEVVLAYDELRNEGLNPFVYSFPTVKPLDYKTVSEIAQKCKLIITIEEHNIFGGFGSAISECVAQMAGSKARVKIIGLNDEYSKEVGNQKYLRVRSGLDSNSLFGQVLTEWRKEF